MGEHRDAGGGTETHWPEVHLTKAGQMERGGQLAKVWPAGGQFHVLQWKQVKCFQRTGQPGQRLCAVAPFPFL
ncbi:hypothetical protein [Schlesneria sp. DSM 10557]|uniref:hypothetical protein n=1 Tax=Schlesneria sp. DSM 10557 TaxID=3044399 RepID=UPI0035A0DC95